MVVMRVTDQMVAGIDRKRGCILTAFGFTAEAHGDPFLGGDLRHKNYHKELVQNADQTALARQICRTRTYAEGTG